MSSNIPTELHYVSSHEWLRVEEGNIGVVGISEHAQESMGDLVYVETPEAGANVAAGDEVGVVESVKAASDIYSPVSGEVLEINEALEDAPETVNNDPYGDGWMFKIKLSNPEEVKALMSADDYQAQIESEDD